jgi:AP-3 complex subunit sigma
VREVYLLVHKRLKGVCNFLEGGSIWGQGNKIIYLQFATLYFIFIVDESESELGTLDLITVFVEILDASFENVCELDIIFHSDKVHYILDELIMGGLVLETNKEEILNDIRELHKQDQASLKQTTNSSSPSNVPKIGRTTGYTGISTQGIGSGFSKK